MRRHAWLAALVLAGAASQVNAQVSGAVTPLSGTPNSAVATTRDAFTLEVQAPDDIRLLLTQHLDLQRYRTLTDLSNDEIDRLMQQAQQDARQLIGTLGYFAPDIRIERQPTPDTTTAPVIHITVVPGEPTRVADVQIAFTGALAHDPDAVALRAQLQSGWSLRSGDRFTQNAWDAAKQGLLRRLTTQHYATGRISTALADIDPATQQAHLSLTLDSGPAYRLGALDISGLQRYDPTLVWQLARLSPGAPYNQADLVAAQQRLADSGYFDSVFVSLDTTGDANAAPVHIKLREAKLQKVVVGVGASTDSGPRLSIEHTHHKVPGIDWRAVSKLQLERDNSAIGSELTSPPNADNWRWVASGLLQNQRLGSVDVSSVQLRGGRKQTQQRIDRNIYLQYDRAESADSDRTEPQIAQSITVNYVFTVRYYDHLPFPASGWGWGAEMGGGATLGSQPQTYSRLLTRWQGFWSPARARAVAAGNAENLAGAGRLAMRASAGAIIAADGIALPSTQLFLAGGDNSVRGYALRSLGVTLADGSVAAGRYLASASAEWQQPLRLNGRLSAWEGTVFVDAGAVANQTQELTPKVGVGARWNSPVGPLQVDLAYGVDVQRFRLHMNLGFTF
ncbi:MAG: outer membrane protein assembly factor [Comamonadaceae bacterium CG12_big_fil_rev_8_21_14_0_65_59_15]|nr:MAG: outer membrane protein assembly factor [Comamonadaceae bacterium CG12_big_fil_rev_8_21_14_0_65_59_15]